MKSEAVQQRGKKAGGTPWWREPWVWFLLAGPAITIVGCVITIVLAVQAYGDQAITEGAVRHGLVVQKVPAP